MPPTRPATISELAAAAADPSPSANRDLKYYLRLAEGHRKAAGAYMARALAPSGNNVNPEAVGLDMERAFIEYARAATLIVETIPAHRDYSEELNTEQRTNLTANGQDILQHLGKLKAALVDRYEVYARSGGVSPDAVPAFKAYGPGAVQPPTRKASQALHTAAQQATADELARWRAQREDAAAKDAVVGYPRPGPEYRSSASASASAYASSSASSGQSSTQSQPTYLSSASQAAVAAAARAAGLPAPAPVPVSLATSVAQHGQAQMAPIPASFGRSNSNSGAAGGAYGAYPSSAGVSFPQPTNSNTNPSGGNSYAASYTSSSPASYAPPHTSGPGPSPPSNSNYASSSTSSLSSYPSTSSTPSHPYTASTSYSTTSSNSVQSTPAPGPMPLRAPYNAYEWESGESTDEEGPRPRAPISYPGTSTTGAMAMAFPAPQGHGQGQDGREQDLAAGMGRLSMATDDGTDHHSVAYPMAKLGQLARHMSSHQRTQGYVPGAWGSPLPPAVPAFALHNDDGNSGNFADVGAGSGFWNPQQGQGNAQTQGQANAALGAARAAASAPQTGTVGYSTPFSPPPDPRAAAAAERAQAQAQAQARADAERAQAQAAAAQAQADRERSEREERERDEERRRNGGRPRLRTVLLPNATLPRFLAIASANTARNLETCGLLLGREVVKGSASADHGANAKTRYVVETLLIPKQHATSDTCTMDEEEGVLGFTEERGLITLGWIHTHPSQSCFMSSVDLHTHASFQCMLPESFAVVCAPKSSPNFGIFRLTDPPGLQTVLKCTAKQAFHPHPDVPIYTDADRGHVQMRDAALEIVDLR